MLQIVYGVFKCSIFASTPSKLTLSLIQCTCISLLCRGFRVKAYYIVGLRVVQLILTRTVSQTRDRKRNR